MKKLFFFIFWMISVINIYPQTADSDIFQQDDYNEFDSYAQNLSEKEIVPEMPKELSQTTIFLRKIGGSLFMKYLAIKKYLHHLSTIFCIKNIHEKNYPNSIYYVLSNCGI